jgi:hypothetical protein
VPVALGEYVEVSDAVRLILGVSLLETELELDAVPVAELLLDSEAEPLVLAVTLAVGE